MTQRIRLTGGAITRASGTIPSGTEACPASGSVRPTGGESFVLLRDARGPFQMCLHRPGLDRDRRRGPPGMPRPAGRTGAGNKGRATRPAPADPNWASGIGYAARPASRTSAFTISDTLTPATR